MARKVRHVMGISGGKDSAALAIYMKNNYPDLDIEYYTTDTGKELEETYQLIDNLENYLGKKIHRLVAAEDSHQNPFDHYYEIFGGFLPSSTARWCTKKLKLDPFEDYVGDDLVISYVGIRGDEDREGYISKKSNIQSIFPFRQNIWSIDVMKMAFDNANMDLLLKLYSDQQTTDTWTRIVETLERPLSKSFLLEHKVQLLLDMDTALFNRVIFQFLKMSDKPMATEAYFPLVDNTDILIKADIFRLLRESGVGVPAYYEPIEFEVDGQKGTYARSRSGCFFCFFQQKIEWVWLLEQHPDRFTKAIEYEKEGYSWMDERLEDLAKPARVAQIKRDYIKRQERAKKSVTNNSHLLLDILTDEGDGCIACFV
ncbi:phosphoadenosine phosphosulfate reductase family protein [Sphingobacterium bambusae]|uniref:Phosphoadenosine phosphosulfate reductase family protein n=1 Tax=Sphingobacterium bambusae TaxID=662858 RepID=A0ABW6BNH1_9SPHI|nr:phosphoadenosine phosphosulfate reductase family protein [Sphingobacterium bambusae]WPL47906.1 phosphoadenosine phosphosulfate reductase family protein [Sphingobacterium bambusae]